MAAVDYASIAAEAAGALTEVGGTAIIRRNERVGGPDYDPEFDDVDRPVMMFQSSIDLTKVTGTLIEIGDKAAMVASAGLAIEITTADRLVIGGVEHAIKAAMPLQPEPGGAIVYYDLIYVS